MGPKEWFLSVHFILDVAASKELGWFGIITLDCGLLLVGGDGPWP